MVVITLLTSPISNVKEKVDKIRIL